MIAVSRGIRSILLATVAEAVQDGKQRSATGAYKVHVQFAKDADEAAGFLCAGTAVGGQAVTQN